MQSEQSDEEDDVHCAYAEHVFAHEIAGNGEPFAICIVAEIWACERDECEYADEEEENAEANPDSSVRLLAPLGYFTR